jgi:hypothetical protein
MYQRPEIRDRAPPEGFPSSIENNGQVCRRRAELKKAQYDANEAICNGRVFSFFGRQAPCSEAKVHPVHQGCGIYK